MSTPGWYADPAGQPQQRYWDGANWTEHVQPHSAPPSTGGQGRTPPMIERPSSPARGHLEQPARKIWYQRKAIVIPLAVLAVLVGIGAIGAAVGPTKKQDAGNVVPLGATTTSQTPAVASSPTSPSPLLTSTTPSSSARATSKPVVPPSSTDDGSFVMPNETTKILQDAQDDIQRVSGDPFFVTHSHDLISSRFQVLDRDWKVCTQNVAPGTKASAIEHIDFGVVKLNESCP